jgi:MFS family permease
MGWGILQDTELSIALAIVCVLVALDVPAGRLARGFVIAGLVGAVIAVVLGTQVANRLWESIGVAVAPLLLPATRPLVVGTAIGAGLGAIVGLLGGTETGGGRSIGSIIRGAIGWTILGALVGAALGAISAVTFDWQVAVALGIAAGLGVWIALCVLEVVRGGIDFGAWTRKFYPSQSIESAKETIEWVRERTPLGPKS